MEFPKIFCCCFVLIFSFSEANENDDDSNDNIFGILNNNPITKILGSFFQGDRINDFMEKLTRNTRSIEIKQESANLLTSNSKENRDIPIKQSDITPNSVKSNVSPVLYFPVSTYNQKNHIYQNTNMPIRNQAHLVSSQKSDIVMSPRPINMVLGKKVPPIYNIPDDYHHSKQDLDVNPEFLVEETQPTKCSINKSSGLVNGHNDHNESNAGPDKNEDLTHKEVHQETHPKIYPNQSANNKATQSHAEKVDLKSDNNIPYRRTKIGDHASLSNYEDKAKAQGLRETHLPTPLSSRSVVHHQSPNNNNQHGILLEHADHQISHNGSDSDKSQPQSVDMDNTLSSRASITSRSDTVIAIPVSASPPETIKLELTHNRTLTEPVLHNNETKTVETSKKGPNDSIVIENRRIDEVVESYKAPDSVTNNGTPLTCNGYNWYSYPQSSTQVKYGYYTNPHYSFYSNDDFYKNQNTYYNLRPLTNTNQNQRNIYPTQSDVTDSDTSNFNTANDNNKYYYREVVAPNELKDRIWRTWMQTQIILRNATVPKPIQIDVKSDDNKIQSVQILPARYHNANPVIAYRNGYYGNQNMQWIKPHFAYSYTNA